MSSDRKGPDEAPGFAPGLFLCLHAFTRQRAWAWYWSLGRMSTADAMRFDMA